MSSSAGTADQRQNPPARRGLGRWRRAARARLAARCAAAGVVRGGRCRAGRGALASPGGAAVQRQRAWRRHLRQQPADAGRPAGTPQVAVTDLDILPDDLGVFPARLAEAAGTMTSASLRAASSAVMPITCRVPCALRAGRSRCSTSCRSWARRWRMAGSAMRSAFSAGNPLAALVGFLTLGRPLLARLSGAVDEVGPAPLAAVAARSFAWRPGREEFMPALLLTVLPALVKAATPRLFGPRAGPGFLGRRPPDAGGCSRLVGRQHRRGRTALP